MHEVTLTTVRGFPFQLIVENKWGQKSIKMDNQNRAI